MAGRYFLERWEAEHKAQRDDQQQNEQPLQQQDEPNNQQVNDQGVEIEPHGGNANEAQKNPQTPSLLDYRGLIPNWQRTQKGSDRGNTTNQDGKGRGGGNTKQDSTGGASAEGKVQAREGVTAAPTEPSCPPSLVKKQGRNTEPNESAATEDQGKPQSPLLHYPRLVLKLRRTQKGRDGGGGRGNTNHDGNGRGKGGSSTMGKATEELATALSKKPVNLPTLVKSQAVEIGPNKGNASKDQGKPQSLLLLEPGEEMLEPKNKWPTKKRSDRGKNNQAGKARGGGGDSAKGKAPEVQHVNNLDEVGRKKAQAKTQGLTTRSNESRPSSEQTTELELSFEEWLKSQTSSDEQTESSSSIATEQASSPKRRTSTIAKSEAYTDEKSGKEENLNEVGGKKAQTKNVGHKTEGCKGKPFRKHDEDSDSPDDDFSFPVQGSQPLKNQWAFVVSD